MNKAYNATNRTLAKYIKNLFIFDHIEEKPLLDDKANPLYRKDGKPEVKSTS